MSIAFTPTLLSLDYFSFLLGMSGANFNQGTSAVIFPSAISCSVVTWQYAWQHADTISREDIAIEISIAEEDIAEQLGYWPAPKWIAQDVKQYPRHHRPDVFSGGGINVRGGSKSVKTRYGRIIAPGRRAVSEVKVPTVGVEVTFSSEDSIAGFDETVTVEVATTLTDECEIKVYFAGHGGDPEWEIRPARTKAISAGTFTATFWAWQFIDPDEWTVIPTLDLTAIDLDDAVYVDSVDVYREYNDTSAVTAVFYWEPTPGSTTIACPSCGGTGCTVCQLTTQNGCIHIRDAVRGYVVPYPATFDTDEEAWGATAWTECRDPDMVKVYYYCGDLSDRNLTGYTCDPLSLYWAQAIAAMATARLERPICSCGNSTALAKKWQMDRALSGQSSKAMSMSLLDNPFGTREGEILAWQRVHRHKKRGGAGVTAI